MVRERDRPGHLVTTFFKKVDLRRFQVALSEPIELDDARPETLTKLEGYGEKLGKKILNDDIDPAEVEIEPLE